MHCRFSLAFQLMRHWLYVNWRNIRVDRHWQQLIQLKPNSAWRRSKVTLCFFHCSSFQPKTWRRQPVPERLWFQKSSGLDGEFCEQSFWNASLAWMCTACILGIYTVNHKKVARTVVIISLLNLDRFLWFLHSCKQAEMFYTMWKCPPHLNIVLMLPCENETPHFILL